MSIEKVHKFDLNVGKKSASNKVTDRKFVFKVSNSNQEVIFSQAVQDMESSIKFFSNLMKLFHSIDTQFNRHLQSLNKNL